MIKTIILDLAGLFIIGSSIYDMYVKHKSKKADDELIRVNKELEDLVNEIKSSKRIDIDSVEFGKIVIKSINKAQAEIKSKLII